MRQPLRTVNDAVRGVFGGVGVGEGLVGCYYISKPKTSSDGSRELFLFHAS